MNKLDWNLANIPPKGDPDVGEFAFMLHEAARIEKERLGVPTSCRNNYALYRGYTENQQTGRKGYVQAQKPTTPINFYFANVERTVSNITARNPVGEVVDLDGLSEQDNSEKILSAVLKKWWKETDQLPKIRHTARNMEIYGITPERPYWDKLKNCPDIDIVDPYAFFPAPGNWDKIDEEAPYISYAYVKFVSEVESIFGVKDIAKDDAYDLMGTEREKFKAQGNTTQQTIGNYATAVTVRNTAESTTKALERCLVIELWIRDNRTSLKTTTTPVLDEYGNPMFNEAKEELVTVASQNQPVYRDGIRKITIAKSNAKNLQSSIVVLDDSENPNINPALATELAKNTYPWGRLPSYHANSYKDGVSVWGFSAAEQVGDLLNKINLIFSKLIAYVINVMTPPLIVQKNCGITREMITNTIREAGRLVLMPTIPNARIEFMRIPDLPQTFFEVLNLIVRFFDRIYQIEDADRGVAPNGVIAAQAIVALQERNQVLMQTKTSAIDMIAEQRSRWAIGLYQNFGTKPDSVNVEDEAMEFYGVEYAGRKLNYLVESGSTTPRTSLQTQELAFKLYSEKAIGQQGLLEALNWPNWKTEVARTASSQVDQALQILVDCGLPEEVAVQCRNIVQQASIQNEQNKGGSQ